MSISSTFSTPVPRPAGHPPTSTAVTGLTGNTPYYWRVNASNAGGTSAWSTVWSFTTAAAAAPRPGRADASSPSNGVDQRLPDPDPALERVAGRDLVPGPGVDQFASFSSTVFDQSGITSTSVIVCRSWAAGSPTTGASTRATRTAPAGGPAGGGSERFGRTRSQAG